MTIFAFDTPTDVSFFVDGYIGEGGNGDEQDPISLFYESLPNTVKVSNQNVSNIALNLGDIPCVQLAPNTWVNGNLTEKSSAWYSINVTNGTTYYLWRGDSDDIYFSGYSRDGNWIPWGNDYGNNPMFFTADYTGVVYISVYGRVPSYSIAYSTTNVRP